MTEVPVRIDQVIPSIVERDAVSHHTLEAQAVLHSLGYESDIYALTMGPGLVGRVKPLDELDLDAPSDHWVCYQASIGSPAADAVAAHAGTKLVNYHNITPAALVESWMPHLGDEVRLGRRQLASLATSVSYGIAVSPYNERELRAWGYGRTTVASLMMDRLNFEIRPSERRLEALESARSGGGRDWLFVGQMLPHKSHHDVVMAFAAYRAAYDPRARLHLVGRDSCQAYALGIERLVAELGLTSSVEIAGSVDASELAAFYEACDLYVSCSDHEGFGAPLLEAMSRGLPIVAYGAAAVPETVGEAGVVLDSKAPATVAAAAHVVLEAPDVRARLVEAGRARVDEFSVERARAEFAAAVTAAVEELSGASPRSKQRAPGTRSGGAARRRPARIDQVTASIVSRDAVSVHALEAQRVLRSLGYVSEIYAATMGPEMAGRAHLLGELPREGPDRQWVCYQGSTGSIAADVVAGHPGAKIVDYHNITPAGIVEAWMPELGDELRLGRAQMAALGPLALLGIGDSSYNVSELEGWGYRRAAVSTLMMDRANFDAAADPAVRAALSASRTGGGADWLFVGQMLPHKSQHDVVLAFAAYRSAYDPHARLHLVGRESCPAYGRGVRSLVADLGLVEAVDFAGLVGAAGLAALYESCDVYVCCSDHEGFCAPLLEAMHHGLPVIAYGAAAVPGTVGDGGVLLDSKAPATVAAAVHEVLSDEALRSSLVRAGRQRSAGFTPEGARQEFAAAIESAVAEWASS